MREIRPTRNIVSSTFPVVGFTVRTGKPAWFEVAVATDPRLFAPEAKSQRTPAKFFSTRAFGLLPAERGEAVYLLPSEVLARFVGQEKLYYALATFDQRERRNPQIAVLPAEAAPFVQISKSFTGRVRGLQGVPNYRGGLAGSGHTYTSQSPESLDWAGDDVVVPGQTVAVSVPPGDGRTATQASAFEYDDGMGPMPESACDEEGIDEPVPDPEEAEAQALGEEEGPEYPQASRFEPAASVNYTRSPSTRAIKRIVIHITDGGSKIGGTISWFKDPNQKTREGKRVHVSAHYVIGRDGEVVQMVRHNDIAHHASGANSDTIGIEHVARKPLTFGKKDQGLYPTEEQYAASAALVSWLCEQYGIPTTRQYILGHSQVGKKNHKFCPQAVWNWDHYMSLFPANETSSEATTEQQGVTALEDESFDINWDDCELVGQPSRATCWATAAAMVLGWRDQISITPEYVADISGRWDQYKKDQGLDLDDVASFGSALGLSIEPPQSYSINAFRELIEKYGPLWVSVLAPGTDGHAIAISGIVGNGAPDTTFVRVHDPWEREPGTPDHPGKLKSGPGPGSRYRLTVREFVREYENLISENPRGQVNVQILHSQDTSGRVPSVGSTYAYSLARSARRTAHFPGRVSARPLGEVNEYAPSNTAEGLRAQLDFQNRKGQWKAGVPDTSFFPHSAICKLTIFGSPRALPSGATCPTTGCGGTGFYISPTRILTAAHNCEGATGITITPGKNGDFGFAGCSVNDSAWYIHDKYRVGEGDHDVNEDYDIAVIDVPTAAPNGQYFDVLEELNFTPNTPIVVCGYAGRRKNGVVEIDSNKQHLDGDTVRDVSSDLLRYNLQTEHGTSGSPVYYLSGRDDEETQQCIAELHVVGVHVTGFDQILNQACRLTQEKITWIRTVGVGSSQAAAFAATSSKQIPIKRAATATKPFAVSRRPGRGFAFATNGIPLQFKELEYNDQVTETSEPEFLDTSATSVALDNLAIYKIIRTVAQAHSGDDSYAAISPDLEFTTSGNPAYQKRQFGLAFGLLLFTQESGHLGSVLRLMNQRDAAQFAEIFGPSAEELLTVTNATTPAQRLQTVAGEPLWSDSWIQRFRRAGVVPVFQAAQNEEAIEGLFRPMWKTASDLGCITDRSLAMAFDRVVTRGVGGGLRWLTEAAGPLRTAAQRAFAVAELGYRDLAQFKVSVGFSGNGNFTPQTHAALVGELRRQGRTIVPTPEDFIARMVAASDGPARQRLIRLRDSDQLQDIIFPSEETKQDSERASLKAA